MNASASSGTGGDSAVAPSLGPYRPGLIFGFFNALTWMTGLGAPMVLLGEHLGASPFLVGLGYSSVFLMLPVQIIATATLPRFGYKRQVVSTWTARLLAFFIPLGLALHAPETPAGWMPLALVGSVFLFSFFRSLGSCGIMPWLYALLPEGIRGRYFGTEQSLTGASGVLWLLFCSGMFALLPPYTAFAWIYGLAILGGAVSLLSLARLPDVPKPKNTSLPELLRRAPALCFERGLFQTYLLLTLATTVMTMSIVPFTAYYLKVEGGLGQAQILFYTAVQSLGGITAALIARWGLDRYGPKPFFAFAYLLFAGLAMFWLVLVLTDGALLPVVGLAYVMVGMAGGTHISAHLKYLPQVCAEDERALAISTHSAVVGVIAGLSPSVLGFFLREGTVTEPAMNTQAFALYFAVTLPLYLLLIIPYSRLPAPDPDRPPLFTGAAPLRLFRAAGNLISLIETKPRRRPGTPSRPETEEPPPPAGG